MLLIQSSALENCKRVIIILVKKTWESKHSRTVCLRLCWCIIVERFLVVLVVALKNRISLAQFKCLNIHLKRVLKFRLTHCQLNKWGWVMITKHYFLARKMAQFVFLLFKKGTIKRKIKICLKSNTVKLSWFSKHTGTRYNQRLSICKPK